MVVRTTSLDNRPLSEYLWFYNRGRKSYGFLYYCRLCVRNFEAKERTNACPKCSRSSIVELPKMQTRRQKLRQRAIRPGWKQFLRQLGQLRLQLAEFAIKTKLAVHYFF